MICTAPRSGSTLLCSLLAATGVAGKPASHFYDPSVAKWLADLGVTVADNAAEADQMQAVVTAALRRGRADTGIFALRQQAPGRVFLCARLTVLAPQATSDAGRIAAVFGRTAVIHLTRADKVDQAVSLLLARQTGLWHRAADGSDLDRTAPHQPPVYDAKAIRAIVADLAAQDQDWTDRFAREGISPLRLTHAEVSGQPQNTVRRVLGAVGLAPSHADGVMPGTRKLANATNQARVARFRSEPAG